MSVNGIVYLVNKETRRILLAGDVPQTYGNITGLDGVGYEVLRDLGANFPDDEKSYEHLGFLKEIDALEMGVSPSELAQARAGAWQMKWDGLADERSDLIQDQRWRIDRFNDETAMGRTPTENIQLVYAYIQAIRDLPITYPDPYNIVWPAIPA